ncbi:hypothetical protein [Nodularia sp. NIES-3585]|nr:hypothetical protein [Nodularia sp. NIES-3585]
MRRIFDFIILKLGKVAIIGAAPAGLAAAIALRNQGFDVQV